jgi:hypothetical protein
MMTLSEGKYRCTKHKLLRNKRCGFKMPWENRLCFQLLVTLLTEILGNNNFLNAFLNVSMANLLSRCSDPKPREIHFWLRALTDDGSTNETDSNSKLILRDNALTFDKN